MDAIFVPVENFAPACGVVMVICDALRFFNDFSVVLDGLKPIHGYMIHWTI